MKSNRRRDQQKEGISVPDAPERNLPEIEPGELEGALGMYRGSLHAAAERPDSFWANQRASIAAKIQRPVSATRHRPALIWASAMVIIALSLTLFVDESKAPAPDLAGGYDQVLLIEVERALSRDYPDALAPAALLNQEIEPVGKAVEHGSVTK